MDGYGNTQILPHPINRPESFKFAILQAKKTPVVRLAEISRLRLFHHSVLLHHSFIYFNTTSHYPPPFTRFHVSIESN